MAIREAVLVSPAPWRVVLSDYGQLVKTRLNLLVVFSTGIGYLIGTNGAINWAEFGLLCLGGFLTVGSANGINQILERESDALMKRTLDRPVVQGRISILHAILFTLGLGILGTVILGGMFNELTALLSLLSLVLYGFVYTPLKKIHPIAVHIGAIPGALPPVIGYVAASGSVDAMAISLFVMQFLWQFPHFYSISWLLDDDYRRAGLKMMPLGTQKGKWAAFQIVIYSALMIPVSFLPFLFDEGSFLAGALISATSFFCLYYSAGLLQTLTNVEAKKLMFGSLVYLPTVQLILLADSLIHA